MKHKINKGFTLVELLAVIAIMGILAILVIPNISKVNQNINERISKQKTEYIESAAELYATNEKDLFNGDDEVEITVQILLEKGYIEADTEYGSGKCTNESYKDTGCVTNNEGEVLNDQKVLLVKKANGVVATIGGEVSSTSSAPLVEQVCAGFGTSYYGKVLSKEENRDTNTDNDIYCGCKYNESTDKYEGLVIYNYNKEKKEYTSTNTAINTNGDACIIVSNKDNGEVDNWLKYGSDKPNWRVIGLYVMDDGKISAKMITSDHID